MKYKINNVLILVSFDIVLKCYRVPRGIFKVKKLLANFKQFFVNFKHLLPTSNTFLEA